MPRPICLVSRRKRLGKDRVVIARERLVVAVLDEVCVRLALKPRGLAHPEAGDAEHAEGRSAQGEASLIGEEAREVTELVVGESEAGDDLLISVGSAGEIAICMGSTAQGERGGNLDAAAGTDPEPERTEFDGVHDR